MRLAVWRPPPDLEPWLSAAIAFEAAGPVPDWSPTRFPASLASALVVVSTGRFAVPVGHGWQALPTAFVGGPALAPVTLYRTPTFRCWGVMVRPAAAAALLGESPAALVQAFQPAGDVFGSRWTPVQQYLEHAHSPEDAFTALFSFVRGRVAHHRHAARRDAVLALQADALGGAASSGPGARQFQRRFSAGLGLRPKLFQRLARAEGAMRDLLARGRFDADLALRHGYFDQSHLGRDFRLLAGASPGSLLKAVRSADLAHWPLLAGARYPGAGIRPDFPA